MKQCDGFLLCCVVLASEGFSRALFDVLDVLAMQCSSFDVFSAYGTKVQLSVSCVHSHSRCRLAVGGTASGCALCIPRNAKTSRELAARLNDSGIGQSSSSSSEP